MSIWYIYFFSVKTFINKIGLYNVQETIIQKLAGQLDKLSFSLTKYLTFTKCLINVAWQQYTCVFLGDAISLLMNDFH